MKDEKHRRMKDEQRRRIDKTIAQGLAIHPSSFGVVHPFFFILHPSVFFILLFLVWDFRYVPLVNIGSTVKVVWANNGHDPGF